MAELATEIGKLALSRAVSHLSTSGGLSPFVHTGHSCKEACTVGFVVRESLSNFEHPQIVRLVPSRSQESEQELYFRAKGVTFLVTKHCPETGLT